MIDRTDVTIQQRVDKLLDQIESAYSVPVLYACESGSRAWGFESRDSDYDIRFVYVQPPEWYLRIDTGKEKGVITLPIEDDLDCVGWDLRKALLLLRKSNPPLLDWLGSPIIYRERPSTVEKIRTLARAYYSPVSCSYHYRNMARGNYRGSLKGQEVNRKKYFYVLRPLLAIRWIEMGLGVVPTEFQKLVDHTVESDSLRLAIDQLLEEKKKGFESSVGPRIDLISEFIDAELRRLEGIRFEKDTRQRPMEALNQLFLETLNEVFTTSAG